MIEILLCAFFFTVLGAAYVKGYDVVKAHSPEHLAHFYLIMAAARMLLSGTAVAIYVLLVAQSREDAIRFALTFIIMYVVMMVVTLTLRH
ncbi:MAG: hypothetical protein IJT98_04335 [Prevotella sp.]|nr:hypothetical protein [Prevotella sp.]